MDYEGVRDYWLENYLNPDHFPYILAEQQKLGSYRQLLNTLLMHGVTKEEFLKRSRPDRDKLADQLDLAITRVLKQWFPSCYRGDAVDYAEAMEWRDERDVYEAMLEYLEEKGHCAGRLPQRGLGFQQAPLPMRDAPFPASRIFVAQKLRCELPCEATEGDASQHNRS